MSERETAFFFQIIINSRSFYQVSAICLHIYPRVICNFYFIKKSWNWQYGGTNNRKALNEQCKGCQLFVLVFLLLTLFLSLDLYPPLESGTKRRRKKEKERRLHLGLQAVTSAVPTGCSQSASLSYSSAKSSQDEAVFFQVECRLLIMHIFMGCVVQVHSHYGLGGHRY